MIPVDWAALGLGLVAGSTISAIFFAGLAFGMQRALHAEATVKMLALSSALRIAMLLGAGWLVVSLAGPWAFAGYGIAFFISRRIATTLARIPAPAGGTR